MQPRPQPIKVDMARVTGGSYSTSANDYDGTNDYATRGGDLTGISDGDQGTFSIWIRIDGGDGALRTIMRADSNVFFAIDFTAGNVLQIQGFTSAPVQILNMFSTTVQTAGASWLHYLASWNQATGSAHIYLNDVDDRAASPTVTAGNIDYTRGAYGFGARPSGASKFNGCISEAFFHTTYLDITQTSNRRKFVDENNKPVSLGADGSTPLGIQPLLYAPNGDPSDNKGSGGNFTITGALDLCSSSPSD